MQCLTLTTELYNRTILLHMAWITSQEKCTKDSYPNGKLCVSSADRQIDTPALIISLPRNGQYSSYSPEGHPPHLSVYQSLPKSIVLVITVTVHLGENRGSLTCVISDGNLFIVPTFFLNKVSRKDYLCQTVHEKHRNHLIAYVTCTRLKYFCHWSIFAMGRFKETSVIYHLFICVCACARMCVHVCACMHKHLAVARHCVHEGGG